MLSLLYGPTLTSIHDYWENHSLVKWTFAGKVMSLLFNMLSSWSLKDELPRSVGAQYATGDQWRDNSRKNEEMEPKQKQHQLWMRLEARYKAVKSNIAQEPASYVHESRQIGSGQTGDG